MSILELYCSVDAFWQQFAPWWEQQLLASGARQRRRATRLSPSELMTIVILFQQSGYRTFKAFYQREVQAHLRSEFPPSAQLWPRRRVAAARARAAHRLPAHPAR